MELTVEEVQFLIYLLQPYYFKDEKIRMAVRFLTSKMPTENGISTKKAPD